MVKRATAAKIVFVGKNAELLFFYCLLLTNGKQLGFYGNAFFCLQNVWLSCELDITSKSWKFKKVKSYQSKVK